MWDGERDDNEDYKTQLRVSSMTTTRVKKKNERKKARGQDCVSKS